MSFIACCFSNIGMLFVMSVGWCEMAFKAKQKSSSLNDPSYIRMQTESMTMTSYLQMENYSTVCDYHLNAIGRTCFFFMADESKWGICGD